MMLVTGASGFLGRHAARRAMSEDWQIIAPPSHATDITVAQREQRQSSGRDPTQ